MKNRTEKLTKWIIYRVNSVFTRGTTALVSMLFGISLVVVFLVSLLAFSSMSGWSNNDAFLSIWKTTMYILDPGNLASEDSSVFIIFLMGFITLLGIFITSTLIGIINNAIQDKLYNLRNKNIKIIEKAHTIIIGFNENTFLIIGELIEANKNRNHPTIVVLGDVSRAEMEDRLGLRVPNRQNTKIICLSGKGTDLNLLDLTSLTESRSIIVNEEDDFKSLKTVLSIVKCIENEHLPYNTHITLFVHNEHNLEVMKIASKGYAEVLHFESIISRIIALTTFQPGLSAVFQELFDFVGNEIYIEHFTGLEGKRFDEILDLFENATVIGIKNGITRLNPPMNTVIKESDDIILIAEDDGVSKIKLPQPNIEDLSDLLETSKTNRLNNETLILETNELLPRILVELDKYYAKGTAVTLVTSFSTPNVDGLTLMNIKLDIKVLDIYNPSVLKELLSKPFRHALLMSTVHDNEEVSDSRTMMLLMHLRNFIKQHDLELSITSEMKQPSNQKIIESANISDFVVSNNIIALMVSQISENKDLIAVFEDLLDEEGAEIYVYPSTFFFKEKSHLSVRSAIRYFAQQSKILIGYKLKQDSHFDNTEKIYINPPKDEKITAGDNLSFIIITNEY